MTLTACSFMLYRVVCIALLVVLIFSGSIFGQYPELKISAQDITVHPDDTDAALSVTMFNATDTVAGFAVWLMFDQPNVLQFTGDIDTVSTLLNDWQMILTNSVAGQFFELKVVALANNIENPIMNFGTPPQITGTLFKLPFDVLQNPTPTLPYDVQVYFVENLGHFNFSDPNGELIGISYDTIVDTSLFICNQWEGEVCLDWQQVSSPPYDSMAIDTIAVPFIDPEKTEINHATITILPDITPEAELIITVHDTTVYSEDGEGILTISMSNFVDTVVGFEIWLQLSNPDGIKFKSDSGYSTIDTIYWHCLYWNGSDCVESVMVSESYPWDWYIIDTTDLYYGIVDTTNTLISDWQYIESRSHSANGSDLRTVGIVNLFTPPHQPGIAPQENGTFIKIPFEIHDNLPPGEEFSVEVIINRTLDDFGFSDPVGNLIGIGYDTVYDTSYYICTYWVGDECLEWQRVYEPPYDSMYIDSNHVVPYLDTNKVIIYDGVVTILPSCVFIIPGDVDGDGIFEISDLVALTNFIHYGTPPLIAPWNGDVDGNCILNWDDVIMLEETGAPFAECTCPNPQWVCCRGLTGNVNYDRYDNALVDDLTFLVDYLFKGGPTPPCIEETLINPSTNDTIPLVSDLTHMVNYLFKGGELPDNCTE